MTTTQTTIFEEILGTVRAVALSVDNDFIYITPDPIFDGRNQRIVQIVTGSPIVVHPVAGHGLVEEEFSICVWWQLLTDAFVDRTDAIASSTRGVLQAMDLIRAAMIQHRLGDEATTPITLISLGHPRTNGQYPDHLYCEDKYRIQYQITWGYNP